MPRVFGTAFALALAACAIVGVGASAAQSPRIGKPRPPPPGPAPVMPLPPAQFDSNLVVGGQDIKARLMETRLGVSVMVNGRGPYRFVVDSGADTSAVGLRIARDLELPLGKPAILNGMTSRDIVDRVKVASLDGQVVNVSPEYDDVAAAAAVLGRPVKAVLAAATAAAHADLGLG